MIWAMLMIRFLFTPCDYSCNFFQIVVFIWTCLGPCVWDQTFMPCCYLFYYSKIKCDNNLNENKKREEEIVKNVYNQISFKIDLF